MARAWSGMRGRMARAAVATVLAWAVLAAPAAARAESPSLGEQYGLGLVSGFGTLLYFPFKMVYATIGGLVGGMTFLVTLGNEETANAVWGPTLGGTYVLTPSMLAGEDTVEFAGSPAPAKKKSSSGGQWPD
jgi:hypothetical protein